MEVIEAFVYVIGFFTIWGAVVGLTWAVDNWIVAPIRGKPFIDKEFWQ